MATKTLGPVRRKFAPWEDPGKTPFISFKNIIKKFGDFVAVNGVTLDIYEREFFALLGPSGCGKSTLLRMLAGFEKPTDGRILVARSGHSRYRRPIERPVNMMFQSYALFPHMTVEREHRLRTQAGRHAEGRDRGARRGNAEARELEQFAKRKPHQLSGGQQQRVALARAIAKRPQSAAARRAARRARQETARGNAVRADGYAGDPRARPS